MIQSRREFLKLSLSAVALAHFGACARLPLNGARAARKGSVVFPNLDQGKAWIYDWDRNTVEAAEIPLRFTHSALQHAGHSEVIFFEQYGPTAAVLSLAGNKVTRTAQAEKGSLFYGHGAFSPDAKVLVTTEVPEGRGNGFLCLRDPHTLRKLGHFSSHGPHPHDLCFLDGDTVAVTNQGGSDAPSNLAFLSVSSGRLLAKVESPRGAGNFGHLCAISEQEVFASMMKDHMPDTPQARALKKIAGKGGAEGAAAKVEIRGLMQYDPAPMCIARRDGSSRFLWDEARKESFRKSFSVAKLGGEGVFVSAHTNSSAVVVWKSGEVWRVIDTPGMYPAALAVSGDGKELVVGDYKGSVRFFRVEDFAEIPGRRLELGVGAVHFLALA